MQVLLSIAAIAAGAALAVQVGVNSMLAARLGGALQASVMSFVVGTIALVIYCLVARVAWPSDVRWLEIPPALWTGGLLGGFYIVSTILLAGRLSAAPLFALIIAGQLSASMLLDHWGALGFAVHPLSLGRLAGLALVIAGVVLLRTF